MLTKCLVVVTVVAMSGLLVSSNAYGLTYNDGYEQSAPSYQQQSYKAQPSYQPQYGHSSYQAAPAYQAPSYSKYRAPSSAHHTQYDNYYPKQTYSKPMYQPKPYSPPQTYHQPAYSAPKPSYPAPAYPASSYGTEEYKA